MPYKDPAAAKARYQRYYQANREQKIKDSLARIARGRVHLPAPPGWCQLCGSTETGHPTRGWAADHDHDSECHPGRLRAHEAPCMQCFRGWLCLRCNTALGLAQDNPQLLAMMCAYLEDGFRITYPSSVRRPSPTPTRKPVEQPKLFDLT